MRPVSNDEEGEAELPEGFDGEVFPLVGDKAAHQEVEILGIAIVGNNPGNIDGWRDNRGRAPIVVLDSLGHGSRSSDKAVHVFWTAGFAVEGTERRYERKGELASNARSQVVMRLRPDITHGCQAVAEVWNPGIVGNGLGYGVAHRDDQVVLLQVKALDGPREEGKEGPVVPTGSPDLRQGARADVQAIDVGRCRTGHVKQRVEVGFGVDASQCIEHALSAPKARKPIMHECNTHPLERSGTDGGMLTPP